MDDEMEHFRYIPEYRLLVCTLCRIAIIESSVEAHFKRAHRKHQILDLPAIRAVQEDIKRRHLDIIQTEQELQDLRLPSGDIPLFPELLEPQPASRCTQTEDH